MPVQYWFNDNGDTLFFQFDNPYYVAPPEPVERLVATGGQWQDLNDFYYFETTAEGRYLYSLVDGGTTNKYSGYDIEYDPYDGKFYDVGTANPVEWGSDNTGTNISVFPTDTNMPIHYWYDANSKFYFQFDNPFYVAPPGYK